jgi:hypothetical protein
MAKYILIELFDSQKDLLKKIMSYSYELLTVQEVPNEKGLNNYLLIRTISK